MRRGKLKHRNELCGRFARLMAPRQAKDLCIKIHYGYTASASTKDTGIKFLRITDIQDGQVDWSRVPYCEIEVSDKENYLLKEGDILFARTGGTVGKSFLIKEYLPESVFASYLIRLILSREIASKYVYYFFQSQSYWNQIYLNKKLFVNKSEE